MNESAQRGVVSVPTAAERKARRRPLTFYVRGPNEVIVGSYLDAKLGPSLEERSATLGADFAEKLDELARRLAEGRQREVDAEEPAPPPPEPGEDPLKLSPEVCEEYLEALRELGASLRGYVSPDLMTKARGFGFPAQREEDERVLSFYEYKAPILWEMMYEGKAAEKVNWRNFWGFRAPITHWLIGQLPPADEICVQQGLFSAFSENLASAELEVTALAERLERHVKGLSHGRLAHALREKVAKEKSEALKEAEWFRCHLQGKPRAERDEWKRLALIEIFTGARSRYELIHFACHCAPGQRSDLHSSLVMQIAGESLALKVLLMSTQDMQQTGGGGQPGPLVFLNACGTARPDEKGKPPAFPEVWLLYGAAAVIATLCPVPDLFAHAFADVFYKFLFERPGHAGGDRLRCVAEALLQARRHFMQHYNNPLGLAYVLYAHTDVVVQPAPPPG
jgi:hypothetical protein